MKKTTKEQKFDRWWANQPYNRTDGYVACDAWLAGYRAAMRKKKGGKR